MPTARHAPFCTECKEPCGEISRDFGIGSYEYAGRPGFHTDVRRVSDCCEADTTDTDPLPDVCHDCGHRMPEGTAWPIDDERLACDACAAKRGMTPCAA